MKYVLLIYNDEKSWAKMSETERGQMFAEYGQFTQQIKDSKHYVTGAPLQPTPTATSVRVREGKRLVTDGPFAETREQLGGFYMINVPDLDTALDWAARCPHTAGRVIEVRPNLVSPS